METPINQLYKYLSDNTNLIMTHEVTSHFQKIEKKYYNDLFNNLYEEVKHGDEEHMAWLKNHFDKFIKANYL